MNAARVARNQRIFWPTIKPFLSEKGSDGGGGDKVILCENKKIVSGQTEVCNIFYNYLVNVAKDIGNDNCNYNQDFSNHPSFEKILEKKPRRRNQKTSFLLNLPKKYKLKKLSQIWISRNQQGLIKFLQTSVSNAISDLINTKYKYEKKLPLGLKQAQVVPLFIKKKDPLNKENFRPISMLPIISKIFERYMHDQLSEHLDQSFNPFLAAFRKGIGCQSTLWRLLEDWRKALDNHERVAAILMDLSKAFERIPHGLLIAKLRSCGLSEGLSNSLKVTLLIELNKLD